MSNDDAFAALARDVVDVIWRRLGDDVRAAFAERIAAIAAEQWRWCWTHSDTISHAIDAEIERHLRETFRPQLEEIARRKALKRVRQRAQQSGVLPIPGLEEDEPDLTRQ